MRQRQDDVAAFGANVVHQFEKGPVVVDVPQQIGEEDQKGCAAADPDPPIEENAALSGEQKTGDHAESEESDGILFLQPDAGHHAEPEPIKRAALDGEDGKISATHPQIGFEAVGAEQASIGKILWGNEDGDSAEEKREAASTEFAGEDGGLHHEKGRSQRGDKTNAAERVSEDSAADVNQKRDEWWLVDVSPGE